MKTIAIPTLNSALTAVMSILFFTGLSQVMGDELLGKIILVQSAIAIVTIACVPQCWVYLLRAQNKADLVDRYRRGFSVEVAGILFGTLIVTGFLATPISEQWNGSLIIFASLAVQASSSCQGWLRANESWSRYTLWVLFPNLIRVPLIWATPWLVAENYLPDARGDQSSVMAIYFLAPDILRWLAIAAPIALRHYRWPGLSEIVTAARLILQNWLFDVGSAVTDVADKVVVGTLLGPQVLVVYFFARRIGVVATMICEPFFAEQYRRTVAVVADLARSRYQVRVYRQGLGLAFVLSLAMVAVVLSAAQLPFFAKLMPDAVIDLLPLFLCVMMVDCLLAGNRWSRFIAQINGGNARLLGIRITLFLLFTLNAYIFGNWLTGLGLAAAFALSWMLEAGYITAVLRIIVRKASAAAAAAAAHNAAIGRL